MNPNPLSWAAAEPRGSQLLSLSPWPHHLPLLGGCFFSDRPVPSLDFRVDMGVWWESPVGLGLGKVYITFMILLHGHFSLFL